MPRPILPVAEYPYIANRWGIEPEQVREALAEVVKHGELSVRDDLLIYSHGEGLDMRRVLLKGRAVVGAFRGPEREGE